MLIKMNPEKNQIRESDKKNKSFCCILAHFRTLIIFYSPAVFHGKTTKLTIENNFVKRVFPDYYNRWILPQRI